MSFYSAYDFIIHSELSLPFPILSNSAEATVDIFYGQVSDKGLAQPLQRGLTYQLSREQFWLDVPTIGRFLVAEGKQIIIEPVVGVDKESLCVFVLGPCMEILLKQRGLLVVPGYALQRDDYAVAFAGQSGRGQSVLQGLFYKQGQTFLGGNSVVLNQEGVVLPGPKQLEFGPVVVSALNIEPGLLNTMRSDIKRYLVPLEHYAHQSLPLKIIYTWKLHQQSEIMMVRMDINEKTAYLHQLAQSNNVINEPYSAASMDRINPSTWERIQVICIHVPTMGLKLQQLVDFIKQDLATRESCYV